MIILCEGGNELIFLETLLNLKENKDYFLFNIEELKKGKELDIIKNEYIILENKNIKYIIKLENGSHKVLKTIEYLLESQIKNKKIFCFVDFKDIGEELDEILDEMEKKGFKIEKNTKENFGFAKLCEIKKKRTNLTIIILFFNPTLEDVIKEKVNFNLDSLKTKDFSKEERIKRKKEVIKEFLDFLSKKGKENFTKIIKESIND